jgi:hypothetical protein
MSNFVEVKRKARVGERIKIVAASCTFGDYANGDVMTVVSGYYLSGVITDKQAEGWPRGIAVFDKEYVVLEEVAETTVEPTGITLIADEALGGILREYTEVKRKAAVGEMVRVFGHRHSAKANGIFRVESIIDENDGYGEVVRYTVDGDPDYGAHYDNGKAYVTLEPTDVYVIDGAKYTLSERKANVGERVIVTNKRRDCFELGAVYEVEALNRSWGYDAYSVGEDYVLRREDSRVIVPVATAASSAPTPDIAQQLEGLTDAVAKITLQLKVAREDIVLIEEGVRGELAELKRAIAVKPDVIAGDIRERFAPKPTPLSRETIVERAKADIEAVKEPWTGYDKSPQYIVKAKICDVEFNVNRSERTVVAIMRWRYNNSVVTRGIAKCAPDDCFNAHIGRAISLRRALGLEVPSEYYSAPQPTEAHVGDIVEFTELVGLTHSFRVESVESDRLRGHVYGISGFLYLDAAERSGAPATGPKVIDDSRELTEEDVRAPSVPSAPNPWVTSYVTIVDAGATKGGRGDYIIVGKRYWVAEVNEGSAFPYRLIRPGYGIKGGVWCARDAFTYGEETGVSAA